MTQLHSRSYTSFDGHRRIVSGDLQTNALAVKSALEGGAVGPVLIFDDVTGRSVDVDIRGTSEDIVMRFVTANPGAAGTDNQQQSSQTSSSRGRGRPKLGVVSREVTLLPRHWEWLASQPGGASVVLRRLVEEARRAGAEKDLRRMKQERAYHFMLAIGGNLPGFEEASRALFANDAAGVNEMLAAWPRDIHQHAMQLAFGD